MTSRRERAELAYQLELAELRQQAAKGLTLTEHQRMHIANRLMLQGPGATATEAERTAFIAGMSRRFNDLPADVLFTLKSLQLLADQGNKVAIWLFDKESERLGLTRKSTFLT